MGFHKLGDSLFPTTGCLQNPKLPSDEADPPSSGDGGYPYQRQHSSSTSAAATTATYGSCSSQQHYQHQKYSSPSTKRYKCVQYLASSLHERFQNKRGVVFLRLRYIHLHEMPCTFVLQVVWPCEITIRLSLL